MVTITRISYPSLFSEGSFVSFDLSDGSHYEGEIQHLNGFYLSINGNYNDIIFSKLDIKEKYKFIKEIITEKIFSGSWPEVSTLKGLREVINALGRYNRIPENKKPVINDDEGKPFTLNVKSKKSLSLNYKL